LQSLTPKDLGMKEREGQEGNKGIHFERVGPSDFPNNNPCQN